MESLREDKGYLPPKFFFKVGKDDFICPERPLQPESLRWVDVRFCDSACWGEGCIKKPDCPAYQKAKSGKSYDDIEEKIDEV